MGGISDQPVDPVENRSLRRVRMWPERGENRLEKRQNGGDHSQKSVSLTGAGHPFAEFHEDARGSGQGQDPGEHHQQTMPLRSKNNG